MASNSPAMEATSKEQKAWRKGSELPMHLRHSPAPKKINVFNKLEDAKTGTIPPLKAPHGSVKEKPHRLDAIADWSGWCGENMCKVYYFKRPLTKTQCMAFGLSYPAFTEGYYKPIDALPFSQFHPDARIAARYIDESSTEGGSWSILDKRELRG